MNAFVKSLVLKGIDEVIAVEPAFAGEVVSYLQNKGLPALETLAMAKLPQVLAKIQTSLENGEAAQPVTITVMPPPVANAPAPAAPAAAQAAPALSGPPVAPAHVNPGPVGS